MPLDSHINDPAAIKDLELALLKSGQGLVRNIATLLYHVFFDHINERTSTATGAEVSRAGGASSFFCRSYEPFSTVAAVAKLVDLLATPFSGDLMEAVTAFERRVT